MILIAHRGNIDGPNPELENSLQYIDKAIDSGYNVEVDIWGSLVEGLYSLSKFFLWLNCQRTYPSIYLSILATIFNLTRVF